MRSATNPESGTICYGRIVSTQCQADGYDGDGNLLYKTDARGVLATYVYDALNRNISVTYTNDSAGTPTVMRTYDGATNGRGKLWKTETAGASASRTTINSFDALGRPTSQSQQFYASSAWSQPFTVSASYDKAGHVLTQTYPSGHTTSYGYDGAGRTSSFAGTLGDATQRTYSTGMIYSAFGAITNEKFGTETPIYNKLFYNVRGQLAEIRESTSYTGPTDTSWNRGAIINHYSNGYGCWGASCNAPDNNGNLMKQEVYIPTDEQGNYTMRWQQYEYDRLNRLSWVREISGGAEVWRQTFAYDRYGNRTIDQDVTRTYGAGINKKDFTANVANKNRLGVPAGQSGTMTYDNAGNLTTDTYSGFGVTRLYDAENRMVSETQANSYVAGLYTYNGDGERVRRKVNGVETWQVYGIGGELLAEYAANSSPASSQKEYGYRNGQLLITAAGDCATCEFGVNDEEQGVHWLVTDQLGAPRMVLGESGDLESVRRHDYLPFGEELRKGDRTEALGYYQADSARQQFTQKERDIETGLDYSIHRYYSSTQGRFTSVDPMMASAELSNPQTMNRYVYVVNNPLRYIDPNGLDGEDPWSSMTRKEQLLLASKLTTVQDGYVPNQKQLAAAGEVFNNKVTAHDKDSGAIDVKQTTTNVASMKAFVAELGSNKQAWAQVDKIDKVSATGDGKVADVTFTVKSNDAFIGALKGDSRFFSAKWDTFHTDSSRLIGGSPNDPSFHIDRKGSIFGAHWDPTSAVNGVSEATIVTGMLANDPGRVLSGVAEMGSAGAQHYGGRATVQQVQKYLTPSKQ